MSLKIEAKGTPNLALNRKCSSLDVVVRDEEANELEAYTEL